MNKTQDINKFYTYLDEGTKLFIRRYDKTYISALIEVLNSLLDNDIKPDYEDIKDQIMALKKDITGIQFDKETIRKSIQLALLTGFKHDHITNAQMTPDSIGIFISYLIKKLPMSKDKARVLDPLVGTANLVASIANHNDMKMNIHGIDDDQEMCLIARNMLDALDIEGQIFHQDTLTFTASKYDLIITDFPPKNVTLKTGYLPYYTISHHLDHLAEDCFFIALIENDFFDQASHQTFQEILHEKAHMYGLIKLDDSLFKTHPKSIFILRKKRNPKDKINDFLLVDLPSFTDQEAFNKAIDKMDKWFNKNKEKNNENYCS